MLWIITFISLVMLGIGYTNYTKNEDNVGFLLLGSIISIFSILILCCVMQSRHSTIYNNRNKIEILESNNKELINQISPLIEKYLNYEQGTFSKLKIDTNVIISNAMYPELKGNTFIQEQINIIKQNNKEIKDLKLELASLENYRIWLFLGGR